MALRITTPGADFSALNLGRRDSFGGRPANLSGEWQFGRNFGTSRQNLANAALPMVEVGSPTYGTRNSAVPLGAGFTTYVMEQLNQTLIWAGSVAAQPSVMFSTLSANKGCNLSWVGGFIGMATGTISSSLSVANPQNYVPFGTNGIIAYRIVDNGANFTFTVDMFKNGVRVAGNSLTSAAARELSPRPWNIGTSTGTFRGASTPYGAEIIDRALSDAELLAEVQAITAIAAARTGAHAVSL